MRNSMTLEICCRPMAQAMASGLVSIQPHGLCGHYVWRITYDRRYVLCQIDYCPWCGAQLKGSLDPPAEGKS